MNVVICNFPPMLKWYLPAAPAILSGACRWLGITPSFIDFNQQATVDEQAWANEICQSNADIVAVSIFSYKSRELVTKVAKHVKAINPNIKIVVGGSGIKDAINGERQLDLTVFDYVIEGDGEAQWPKFLVDYFKLEDRPDFANLATPYYPDFSGYNTEQYNSHAHKLWIPITGSRGCVRRCTFCEIPTRWKFQQRNPDSIAIEVYNILEKFPDVHIHFTDSLVNGSLPAFDKIVNSLITLKKQFPNFTWGGQFIIRNKKQCNDEYWRKIAESGARTLEIGVETGSDTMRWEIGKHFTNDDLDDSLQKMSKYGITCVLLFLTGYPTETEDDFNQTLALLTKHKGYAGNVIECVQAGCSLNIAPGTPLHKETIAQNNNILLSKNTTIWFNTSNPTLTHAERHRRRLALRDTALDSGYIVTTDDHASVVEIEENIKQHHKIIEYIENKFGKNI